MTRPPSEDAWAFLDPWFVRLRGCIAVDNPSRADTDDALSFGRDAETDWWLRVDAKLQYNHERRTAGDSAATQVRHRREALLLVGTLASVDNAAWVHKLCTLSAFVVPPFLDVAFHELRALFVVAFSELTSPNWEVLACWLQRGDYSDEFKRDYKLLLEQVDAHMDAESLLSSITPRLRFRFMDRGEAFLQFIASMLAAHRQEVEEKPDLPGLCLDSIDLTVLCMWGEPSVPDLLRRIVELDVPIEHMNLSIGLPTTDADRLSAGWRENFIQFVRALCGHGENARGGVVKKLTIPEMEVVHPDFELLCSGLQHSRGIRHFAIGADVDVRASDPADPFPPGIWALIALALLSRDSSTSVEALSVRGVPITLEDTEAVFDMVALVHPMHAYVSEWVPNSQPPRPANRVPRKVCIPPGTTVSAYYGFEEEEYTIDLEHDTEAFVTFEDSGVSHVLIPGRGFCRVPSSALPSKRLKQTQRRRGVDDMTCSLLKSLELVTHPLDTTSQAQVKEFLQFAAGPELQRLRLNIPNLGDQEIRAVLDMCPNLEYLAVSHVSMSSMAAFDDAHAAGVRLRSLELAQLHVPDQPLVDFVRGALARKGPNEDDDDTVLTGLRLGQVSDSVLEQLGSSLDDSSIQYLDYSVTKPVQSTYARFAEQHNRRPTGDILAPVPTVNTMAFFGSIHFRATTRPAFSLADEMKALIVNFASTPQTRIVVCREVGADA